MQIYNVAFLFFNISAFMGAGLAPWNEQTTTRCTAEPAACMSSPLSFLSVFTIPIRNMATVSRSDAVCLNILFHLLCFQLGLPGRARVLRRARDRCVSFGIVLLI